MKPESLKVMQNLLENADYLCNDKEFIKSLKEDFLRIIRIEGPSTVSTKFNWYNYVSTEKFKPLITGVYHTNGLKVATDATVLVVRPEDYPEDLEGKIVNKEGEIIEGKYPNFQAVIPDIYDGYENHTIDIQKVKEIASNVKDEAKVTGSKKPLEHTALKVGNVYFRLDKFLKVVSFMQASGCSGLWTKGYHPAAVINEYDKCIIMPCNLDAECNVITLC